MIDGVVTQILPAGFTLPWFYLIPVAIAAIGVGALLLAIDPPITDWTVLAFIPWIVLGSVWHVLYQQGAYPDVIEPLFGNPMVYLTTFTVAGFSWILSSLVDAMRTHGDIDRQLGVFGTGFAVMFLLYSIVIGSPTAESGLFALLGSILGGLIAAVAWLLLSLRFTDVAAAAGVPGALVVFAHAMDSISTAMAYDLLPKFGERTPLSRLILEFSAGLPTADVIGAGWLFVLVKLALAMAIVVGFKDLCEERPDQARAAFTLVIAVGLGPAVNNLLLFVVRGSSIAFPF